MELGPWIDIVVPWDISVADGVSRSMEGWGEATTTLLEDVRVLNPKTGMPRVVVSWCLWVVSLVFLQKLIVEQWNCAIAYQWL